LRTCCSFDFQPNSSASLSSKIRILFMQLSGNYKIKAKLRDEHGVESEWGTLEITIPRSKRSILNFNIFVWLNERYSNLFPMLRYLLRTH